MSCEAQHHNTARRSVFCLLNVALGGRWRGVGRWRVMQLLIIPGSGGAIVLKFHEMLLN